MDRELPGEHQGRDWRIVGLNPPDTSLQSYERAVVELLLGDQDGADAPRQVLVSELRERRSVDLTAVRDTLYSDVVDKGWFSRRPDTERNLLWWAGVGLAVAGAALTVVLALTTTVALLGAGVVVGGIALTFGARLMPARAVRGSSLVAQMRGLRDYLRTARADDLPPRDREMVFSRSLPYAVVLGETNRWLGEFAELDPGADGTPGLYWYGELLGDAGPRRPRPAVLPDALPDARPGPGGCAGSARAPPSGDLSPGTVHGIPGRLMESRAGPWNSGWLGGSTRDGLLESSGPWGDDVRHPLR